MTAVVFPQTPGVSPSPIQSAPEAETASSLLKSVAYYGLLLGGALFPVVGGIVGLLTH